MNASLTNKQPAGESADGPPPTRRLEAARALDLCGRRPERGRRGGASGRDGTVQAEERPELPDLERGARGAPRAGLREARSGVSAPRRRIKVNRGGPEAESIGQALANHGVPLPSAPPAREFSSRTASTATTPSTRSDRASAGRVSSLSIDRREDRPAIRPGRPPRRRAQSSRSSRPALQRLVSPRAPVPDRGERGDEQQAGGDQDPTEQAEHEADQPRADITRPSPDGCRSRPARWPGSRASGRPSRSCAGPCPSRCPAGEEQEHAAEDPAPMSSFGCIAAQRISRVEVAHQADRQHDHHELVDRPRTFHLERLAATAPAGPRTARAGRASCTA